MTEIANLQARPDSCRRLGFSWQVHALAWGGMLALVLLLIVICHHYAGRNVWSGWVEARESRAPGYAERIYPGDVLRTRANFWSNLAYWLVGFYALALARRDRRRKPLAAESYLVGTPPLSVLFGALCCYLGFGSGFYHASLSRWGQQLDVAAMYAPLLALIAINVGGWMPRLKLRGRAGGFPTWPFLAGLVLVANVLLYEYKWSMSAAKVLPALILTVSIMAVVEQFRRRRPPAVGWLALSLVALISARVCWTLDVAKKFSGPDSWLQGHSLWHLLTALSLASLYLFYRTGEKSPDRGFR